MIRTLLLLGALSAAWLGFANWTAGVFTPAPFVLAISVVLLSLFYGAVKAVRRFTTLRLRARGIIMSLAAAAMVGLTAWTHGTPMFADGILPGDVEIDAWEGLCSQADALGDSLLRFPCAVGWAANGAPQQDSIRAGTGTVKVWKVTDADASNTGGPGTLGAALDSAAAYDDGKTCSYIIIPEGGAYRQYSGGNWDGISCVRFSFQTAQGEGANIHGGRVRARAASYIMVEYWYSRRPSEQSHWPTHSSDMMCTSYFYYQHGSASWGDSLGSNNLAGSGCGTNSIPLTTDTARGSTAHRMLLGEPMVDHPTHMNFQGLDAGRHFRVTVLENVFTGPGHRCPRVGNSDTISVVRNLVYNCASQYGESANLVGKLDVFDNLFIPGPASPAESDLRRWAWTVLGADDIDTLSMSLSFKGNRAPRSGYDETMHPDSFVFGSNRDVSVRCSNVTWCVSDGEAVKQSMIRYDTLPTASFANAEVEFGIVMDSVEAGKILQIAGNSRYLNCSGQWTLRSDTVDARFRQTVLDSIGPSGHVNSDGGGRTYGTPASGTACTDADDDGLPDSWETAQVGDNSLDVDSVANARPAIEWYLAGRNLDGSLVGCNDCSAEEGGGASAFTFGAVNRRVYFLPTTTIFGVTLPDTAIAPIRFGAWNAARDTMMVVVCVDWGTPADSATVDARLSAWARTTFNTAVAVRDFEPPYGMEC